MGGSLWSPLRGRAFRLLWLGESLAGLAEQLFVVALTLLVLDVAGAGAAVGTVLAAAAVPRGVLLPLGGVLADRVAPHRIALATTVVRAAVLAAFSVLVVAGPPGLWTIGALAALLAVLDALYWPAALSLPPEVVRPGELAAANALTQGSESVGDLAGPALGAGVVAAFGLGAGFAVVCGLHALAALLLAAFARRHRRPADATVEPEAGGLREGLRFALGDPVVRTILLVLAALNVAVAGPFLVGGAVLAAERLGGSEQLGLLLSSYGAGALLGLLLAGTRGLPRRRGLVLALGTAGLGIGTAAFGAVGSLAVGLAIGAAMGVVGAYFGVVLVAWLQERVPADVRGRVMGLVAFAAVALDPVSFALAGWLLPAGLGVVFGVAGAILVLAALASLADPAVRRA